MGPDDNLELTSAEGTSSLDGWVDRWMAIKTVLQFYSFKLAYEQYWLKYFSEKFFGYKIKRFEQLKF